MISSGRVKENIPINPLSEWDSGTPYDLGVMWSPSESCSPESAVSPLEYYHICVFDDTAQPSFMCHLIRRVSRRIIHESVHSVIFLPFLGSTLTVIHTWWGENQHGIWFSARNHFTREKFSYTIQCTREFKRTVEVGGTSNRGRENRIGMS